MVVLFRLQIRQALNQQTALQFRQYAEQQCPGSVQAQDVLISQLQEQHFQQYMQQVYQQQVLAQQQHVTAVQLSQTSTYPSAMYRYNMVLFLNQQ